MCIRDSDKGYICPVYCEVDHKHRLKEYETQTKQAKQDINEETDTTNVRSVIITNR